MFYISIFHICIFRTDSCVWETPTYSRALEAFLCGQSRSPNQQLTGKFLLRYGCTECQKAQTGGVGESFDEEVQCSETVISTENKDNMDLCVS